MKIGNRRIALILAVIVLVSVLSGCGEKNDVKNMLESFENNCKSLDVLKMIEHLDPTISEPILGLAGLLGIEDTGSMMQGIVETLDFFGDMGSDFETMVQSMEIEARSFEFNENKDSCEVEATISYGTGENTTENVVAIECVLENDTWYISNIKDK